MKTRSRFSIHTGSVARDDVAAKLIDNQFFHIFKTTEHVHASVVFDSRTSSVTNEIQLALGYMPSRVCLYYQYKEPATQHYWDMMRACDCRGVEQTEENNDHEQDGS
jgi:hypothetical protein